MRSASAIVVQHAGSEIVGSGPKVADPATSKNAIPKGASPSRVSALRTTAAGGSS